jgi:hypothetical protein
MAATAEKQVEEMTLEDAQAEKEEDGEDERATLAWLAYTDDEEEQHKQRHAEWAQRMRKLLDEANAGLDELPDDESLSDEEDTENVPPKTQHTPEVIAQMERDLAAASEEIARLRGDHDAQVRYSEALCEQHDAEVSKLRDEIGKLTSELARARTVAQMERDMTEAAEETEMLNRMRDLHEEMDRLRGDVRELLKRDDEREEERERKRANEVARAEQHRQRDEARKKVNPVFYALLKGDSPSTE